MKSPDEEMQEKVRTTRTSEENGCYSKALDYVRSNNGGELSVESIAELIRSVQADTLIGLTNAPWLVDWRPCPKCKQQWPHPSVTSNVSCPTCRYARAVKEEREACAKIAREVAVKYIRMDLAYADEKANVADEINRKILERGNRDTA